MAPIASLAAALLVGVANAGSNGMAMTPPLTWRSWNQYGWYIDQGVLLAAAKGLVDTSRPIKGKPAGTSLRDLGFNQVGMDEGWATCPPSKTKTKSGGTHGRDPSVDPRAAKLRTNVTKPFSIGGGKTAMYHRANADGSISPVVDKLLFPDMKKMVDDIHGMGVYVGWYLNDCLSYCQSLSDECSASECIPGDVKAFIDYGFDALKVDGCSAQKDVHKWASLIYAAGNHNLTLEDCNNGPKPVKPITQGGCPDYHQYRTSGDINNGYASWVGNAQTVMPFATSGRSGPTCWAYPDMLMIGVQGQCPDEGGDRLGPWSNGFKNPSVVEQRTHFGLWCTLSAPLTLSMDFTNTSNVDSVWSIVSNTDAIGVNQAWGGHPGTVFAEGPDTVLLQHTDGRRGLAPTAVASWQAWYKPLPHGGAAIFVANHGAKAAPISIDFADVPGLGPPPPLAHCDAKAFPVALGDAQCMGLQGPKAVHGRMVNSSAACCAACSAAGAACETWGFCGMGEKCATTPTSRTRSKHGTPGCFLGKSANCPNKTDGWVAARRGPGPVPPTPPPPAPPARPKLFKVFDVWAQAPTSGSHASYSVPALARHDSIFITVEPA